MENLDLLVDDFQAALLQIDRLKAEEIFAKCYKTSNGINQLENLTINSLETIGDGWENGTVSLSQVYMSGVICEELMGKYLAKSDITKKDNPKIAIGVLQDYHSLGKRIVSSVLYAGGFQVVDLGSGLNVDELVEKTIENEIEILLISTLMLPSALKVKEVVDKLMAHQFEVKVVVGGAPFRLDSNLWKNVGADANGKSAAEIIGIIESLLEGGN
jgi:methanogenic corrinoid protein MtbC1